MNTITVWVLVAFLGAEPWPGATLEHQIPEEYSSKSECEKGKVALQVTNKIYTIAHGADYSIDYSICIRVPVKKEKMEVKK